MTHKVNKDLVTCITDLGTELKNLNNLLQMVSDEELSNLLLVTQKNKNIEHEVWLTFDSATLSLKQINTLLLKVIASQR